MSKISRTVRGGEEVARNVRKGCRTLDEEEERTNEGFIQKTAPRYCHASGKGKGNIAYFWPRNCMG
jgi:hypothetical protein